MQGGLLWYFHTYVGSGHLFIFFFLGGGGGGLKLRISIFMRFSEKKEFFGGYEDFVDIFLGSSKTWTMIMGHFCAF